MQKESFHLSSYYLQINNDEQFVYPPRKYAGTNQYGSFEYEPILKNGSEIEIDDAFFFSIPNASFTIDTRIPSEIREPLIEGSECLKNNFLIGASGCIQKAVYKLLLAQHIPQTQDGTDKFLRYEDRIYLLKTKLEDNRHVHAELWDSLKGVHGLTSQELHENDWKDFSGPELRFLGELVKELLKQIYIEQDEVEKRQAYLREHARLPTTSILSRNCRFGTEWKYQGQPLRRTALTLTGSAVPKYPGFSP